MIGESQEIQRIVVTCPNSNLKINIRKLKGMIKAKKKRYLNVVESTFVNECVMGKGRIYANLDI